MRAIVRRANSNRAKWFLADTAKLRHEVQLICFPHTGGCASTYREWLADLATAMDVLPVQLPGRETRIREPFATDMRRLVDEFADLLQRSGFHRIALFGHSLGAVIALKVCQAIERAGTEVAHLFVSGHKAPPALPVRMHHRPGAPFSVSPDASDGLIIESLAGLDMDMTDWLVSNDLREVFMPVLRADMRLLATAEIGGELVDAPVTALGGREDPLLLDYDLGEWARVTRTHCTVHQLPGRHFYLGSQGPAVARLVRDRLGEELGKRGEPGAPTQQGD